MRAWRLIARSQISRGEGRLRVRVNGEEKELAEGATVAALLASMSLEASGIAVAVNMEVVRRGAYGDARLAEGDEVEIVRAVGGG